MASKDDSKCFISYDYPHSLMLHISAMLKEKAVRNVNQLLQEEFWQEFEERYNEYPAEIRELQVAYHKKVISGFVENNKLQNWKKRVFISKAFDCLLRELKEYEAVELLESFMHILRWEFEVECDRIREVTEEEKARFHQFDKSAVVDGHAFANKVKAHLADSEKKKIKPPKRIVSIPVEDTESIVRNVPQDAGGHVSDSSIEEKAAMPVSGKKDSGSRDEAVILDDSAVREEKDIVQQVMLEDEISEAEYRKQLQEIKIKHESLMSISVRREVKKAKKGDAMSQCFLGDFYAEEQTEHTDYEEAVKWYAFSARQGNFKAKFEMGRIFDSEKLEGKNTKQYGIQCFQKLADEGYPTAQCIMGLKYYFGDGVEKDTSKGVQWLKKAAYQGHVEAQRQLGDLYAPLDQKEAAKWYQMAKANGDLMAERKLRALR